MQMTITEPERVRAARFREWQRTFLLKWARTSVFSTLASLALLLGFYLLKAINQEVILLFLFGPILLSAGFLALVLVDVRLIRSSWKWNDEVIVISGRAYRWKSFQAYSVMPAKIVSGCSTFALQCKDGFLSKGLWMGITCENDDLAPLIKAAETHVDKSG